MRALPLLILLTACSGENPLNQQAKAERAAVQEAAVDAKAVHAGFHPPAPAPLATVRVDPIVASAPAAILPPASQQYRYIGHWAENARLCAGKSWLFRTRDLKSPTEVSCDYPTVATVRAGYELQGVCRANGKKSNDTIRLDFDEARKSMHVTAQSLGQHDLIYCGD